MKVKVIVDTVSRFECELEASTVEDAIAEAKMDALGEGDYVEQKAEFEILEPNPPAPLRLVPRVPSRRTKPFWS